MKKRFLLIAAVLLYGRLFAQESDYEKGVLIIKFKDHFIAKESVSNYLKIPELFEIESIKKVFSPNDSKNSYYERLNQTYCIRFCKPDLTEELVLYLKNNNMLEYVEKVPLIELLFIPNDSLYKTSISGANAAWPLKMIGAETAWNYSQGSPQIKIAIIDNAIWTNHPDLAAKVVDKWDFADNDNDPTPYSSNNDAQGRQWSHGTHVAGLAGAETNNNRGVASIGFNSSIMAYKMYKNGALPLPDLTGGCTAIQTAADRGAHVINVSWGSTNALTALEDAVNYAHVKGVVVVAAAGNNGQEQAYYPAAYNHVIAVASVGMDDKKSSFSNYGNFVDVSAPGGYGPNDAGTWSPVSTTYHNAYAWAQIIGPIKYDGKVGTSMAAPIVSGLCALILSVDSMLSPDSVESILKTTSVNNYSVNPSYSGKLGVGRINAGAALALVSGASNISHLSGYNPINIFPNPSDGFIHISNSNHEIYEIQLFSINGALIEQKKLNGVKSYSFDTSLPEGFYIMRIITSDFYYHFKLQIIK